MKILVVDDSKHIQMAVAEMLAKMGHDSDGAENGQVALDKLENSKYDLVLLDWNMPVKNGLEVLKELKKSTFPCPVIMMTTENSIEKISQAIENGASEYIMKPFTEDILASKFQVVG